MPELAPLRYSLRPDPEDIALRPGGIKLEQFFFCSRFFLSGRKMNIRLWVLLLHALGAGNRARWGRRGRKGRWTGDIDGGALCHLHSL